jgi:hypothetical protein
VDRWKIMRTKLELKYIGKKHMGWPSTWWFSQVLEIPRREEQAGENVGRQKRLKTSYTSTHIK